MSGDDHALNLVYLVVALMIALSALSIRRLSFWVLVRSILSWAIIGVIVYIGVVHRYELAAGLAQISDRLGFADQSVEGRTVRIRMSPDGHFWARVDINGVQRRMLIDSGATLTALSEKTAAAAGVQPSTAALPVLVDTANGMINARPAQIERLAIGPLHTQDLRAVVAPAFGEFDVLGMNFLGRLKSWRVDGDTLVLEPKQSAREGVTDTR